MQERGVVEVQDHARLEMRVWIGFVVVSSSAFLATLLASERLTPEQMEVLFL